jgi:hypothetical protein
MFAFSFFFFISQHPAWEQFLSADDLSGDHEHAVARVVQRLRALRRNGDIYQKAVDVQS